MKNATNEHLIKTQARLAKIVASSHDAIATSTPSGVITSWNKGAESLSGYLAAQVIGRPDSLVVPVERRAEVARLRERVSRGEHVENVEFECQRGDGTRVPALISAFRIPGEGDEYEIAAVARDLTAQRTAEAAVRAGEQRLHAFLTRLVTLREEERTKISRDIHDVFGQRLTALKMDVAWLAQSQRHGAPLDSESSVRLGAIAASIDDIVRLTRELATELRPGILDKFGLVATAEWELRAFSSRTGIRATLDARGAESELAEVEATAAYRILQEALTNVARHANAHHVRVTMSSGATRLTMEVQDDGEGISEGALEDVRSLGLIGMSERARLAGGLLSISRGRAGGTMVSLVYSSRSEGRP